MSTSTPTTQPPSTSTTPSATNTRTTPLLHNASLLTLVVCPILIALPPRKLDIYTLGLMTCTFIGGNHLTYEYTGVSMGQRISSRFQKVGNSFSAELPDRAKEVQGRLREELKRKNGVEVGKENVGKGWFGRGEDKKEEGRVLEEVARRRREEEAEEEERKKRGILQRVWMGDEGKDWKQKRDQREKEALDEGKGYGDLIMEQIWEVWNGGKEKVEEIKEKDEKVVEERRKK